MDIKEWLEHPRPSYQAGLLLLQKYSESGAFLKLFSLGLTQANAKLMRERLEIILKREEEKALAIKEKSNAAQPADDYTLIKNINKNEFQRAVKLHQSLSHPLSTKADRYDAAKQIIELFEKKIIPTQKDLRYHAEHGKLPDVHFLSSTEMPRNWVDIKQKILNLRSRISKCKKIPDRASDVIKWKAEIEQLQIELDAIQSQ